MWFARFMERHRLAVREARLVRVSLLLSGVLNFLAWGLSLWFMIPRRNYPFLALHYTVYFGVDRIGPPWHFLLAPALGTLILAINVALAARWHVMHRLAGEFLMVFAVILEALILVSVFLTMLLNL